MDGVFVDTEPLVFPVFRKTFGHFSINLTDEYQYRFIGKPFSSNLADIRRDFGIDFDADKILQEFEQHYERIISEELCDLQAGVAELISYGTQRGLLFGLCTTSTRHHVNIVFDILSQQRGEKIAEWLDAIVCGDDVTHRKPHPEPYLAVIEQLGVQPQSCLVIEDTMTGMQAARAAGCRTVALRQPYNGHHDFSDADAVITKMNQAIQLLEGKQNALNGRHAPC